MNCPIGKHIWRPAAHSTTANLWKNEIDDFLREAILYHVEEKKFVIMGTLIEYLENNDLFEGSRDLFRRLPAISGDIFFDTDMSNLSECSDYLAEKEQPALFARQPPDYHRLSEFRDAEGP